MKSDNGVDFVPRWSEAASVLSSGRTSEAERVPLDFLSPPRRQPPPVSATLFTQRDVDIRFDRVSQQVRYAFQHLYLFVLISNASGLWYLLQLILLQGDVGSADIYWSISDDNGHTWLPWSRNRTIAVNHNSSCNHNPGLAALPDGSFGGRTLALIASAFDAVPHWGRWHLWRTNVSVGSDANCAECAPAGCDHACSIATNRTSRGVCAVPNSTDPGNCCHCEFFVPHTPCQKCASSAGGCVELCRQAGHNAGMCKYGDHSDKGLCCQCFP